MKQFPLVTNKWLDKKVLEMCNDPKNNLKFVYEGDIHDYTNGLIQNTAKERGNHMKCQHNAIGRFLSKSPPVGQYKIPYHYRGLRCGYGEIDLDVRYPGVGFANGRFCIQGHYIDMNKNNVLFYLYKNNALLQKIPRQTTNKQRRRSNLSCIESILKLGFDVNTTMPIFYSRSKIQRSLFSRALEWNQPDVAMLALRYGANPFNKIQYTQRTWGSVISKSFDDFIRYILDKDARTTIKMKVKMLES